MLHIRHRNRSNYRWPSCHLRCCVCVCMQYRCFLLSSPQCGANKMQPHVDNYISKNTHRVAVMVKLCRDKRTRGDCPQRSISRLAVVPCNVDRSVSFHFSRKITICNCILMPHDDDICSYVVHSWWYFDRYLVVVFLCVREACCLLAYEHVVVGQSMRIGRVCVCVCLVHALL